MIWRTRLAQRCLSLIILFSISSTLVLMLAPHADAGIFDFLFRRRQPGQAGRGSSEGASIRDDGCNAPTDHRALLAMAPAGAIGTTTKSHPTFLFYVPFARSPRVTQAEFMLLNQQQDYVIARPIRVALPETPGLVRFTLPETMMPLAANQRYNWYFSIVCDAEEPSRNPIVSGWVQRIEPSPDLTSRLQILPRSLHYQVYNAENIWYDTLADLADHQQDASIQQLWLRVLAAYELEDVVQQNITDLVPVDAPSIQSSALH